jgi:hypothetical protein
MGVSVLLKQTDYVISTIFGSAATAAPKLLSVRENDCWRKGKPTVRRVTVQRTSTNSVMTDTPLEEFPATVNLAIAKRENVDIKTLQINTETTAFLKNLGLRC